jgi:hypothetical protein
MELEQAPLLMLGFPLSKDAFLVGLASRKQVIKEASELMGCGGDSFWCTEFGAHAAIVVAERGLVVMQGMSRNTQRKGSSVLHMTGADGENLAPADAVVGTQPQPGGKRSGAAKLG